jgi:hypothetical protein
MAFRPLHGRKIDVLAHARHARTGVEMIERFCGGNLTAGSHIDWVHGKRT